MYNFVLSHFICYYVAFLPVACLQAVGGRCFIAEKSQSTIAAAIFDILPREPGEETIARPEIKDGGGNSRLGLSALYYE